jgi:hypothetical protein
MEGFRGMRGVTRGSNNMLAEDIYWHQVTSFDEGSSGNVWISPLTKIQQIFLCVQMLTFYAFTACFYI